MTVANRVCLDRQQIDVIIRVYYENTNKRFLINVDTKKTVCELFY